ncbi:MAG: hypothetical protein AB7F82_05460 [Alphaproteobacteria bacterium]
MSTNDPYSQMAKDAFQMWQKQWASVMGDKQFIHAMLQALQTMQQGVYGTTGATSPSHAAAAHDDDERVAQLARRVEQLEKRVAKLESAAKPRAVAKKPAKRSVRSRK